MTVTRGQGGEVVQPRADGPARGADGEGRQVLVVGVDGSAAGTAALTWAAGQARPTGARVVAVAACEPQAVLVGGADVGAGVMPPDMAVDDEQRVAEAEGWLTDAITLLPVEAGQVVERRVAHGEAASLLLEVALDADLLVLGNHRHGALAGALLGSVAQRCVRHAGCPLVLVPAR